MLCPDTLQTIFSFLLNSQVYQTRTVSQEWNANATLYLERIPRMGIVRKSYVDKFKMLSGSSHTFQNTLPEEIEGFTLVVGSKNFHTPQDISLLPSFSEPTEIKSACALREWNCHFVTFTERAWRAIQTNGRVTIVNPVHKIRPLLPTFWRPRDYESYLRENTVVEVYADGETPSFLKGMKVEPSPNRKLTIEERREELRKMRDDNTVFLQATSNRLGFSSFSYRHRTNSWVVFSGVSSQFF